MTRVQQYLDGMRSFIPEPADNPDCIPFYRAWRGMQTVLGKEQMDRWQHLLHQAICWSLGKPEAEQYGAIVANLRHLIVSWTPPESPRPSYSYECAPAEPTEKDAREFFNGEYKRAFPGKRANSKHANALWLEKREQAMQIVRGLYQQRLDAYNAREKRREDENAKRRQDWIAHFWSMAQFEQFVRSLDS